MKNALPTRTEKYSLPIKILAVILSVAMICMFSFPTLGWGAESTDVSGASNVAANGKPTVSDNNAPSTTNNKVAALSNGEGTQASPYLIKNANDLIALAKQVNAGASSKGRFYALTSDITLPEENWTPIGNGTRVGSIYIGSAFKGTLDGKGHTISGLTITGSVSNKNACVGLFGVLDGGNVRNLDLANANLNVTNAEVLGALAGLMVNNANIDSVTVSGTVSAARGTGGIVGRMVKSGTVNNCTNNAVITTSGYNVGGIVGAAYYTAIDKMMNISDCTNNGTVTGAASDVGGIVGLSAANVLNCKNTAAIVGNGYGIGGIVGEQQNYGVVEKSKNTGTVTCQNETENAYGTGGIVGWVRYNGSITDYPAKQMIVISGNNNSAPAKGGVACGGIVGTVYNSALVTENVNTAPSIEAVNFAAGIVGNYQDVETPGLSQTNPVPKNDLTVTRNATTTTINNIFAVHKTVVAYLNTNEGTTVQDNVFALPQGNVNVTTPNSETSGVSITDESSLENVSNILRNTVASVMAGETPMGLTQVNAQKVQTALKSAPSNDVHVTLLLDASKFEEHSLPAADQHQIARMQASDAKDVATFDITMNLQVNVQNGQSNSDTTVPITEIKNPIIFDLMVSPSSIQNCDVSVVSIHDGNTFYADVVGVDEASGVIQVSADKFSTYTVVATPKSSDSNSSESSGNTENSNGSGDSSDPSNSGNSGATYEPEQSGNGSQEGNTGTNGGQGANQGNQGNQSNSGAQGGSQGSTNATPGNQIHQIVPLQTASTNSNSTVQHPTEASVVSPVHMTDSESEGSPLINSRSTYEPLQPITLTAREAIMPLSNPHKAASIPWAPITITVIAVMVCAGAILAIGRSNGYRRVPARSQSA